MPSLVRIILILKKKKRKLLLLGLCYSCISSSPGKSDGEGNGIPHQYSCLENSMGRGAW